GFYAKSLGEEMHIEDFVISFLVRVDDVTADMLAGVTPEMDEAAREEKIAANRKSLLESRNPDKKLELDVKSFFYGNEYYLFEYKTYRDIRLVAAPPESVGKYGGDTDNWMWPRHTGDFSMLRIYAGPDNQPADYSKDNVPYVPRHHLKINAGGVKPGDFTMVMGYPGSTDRFLSSRGVRQALDAYNPSVVEVRDLKLRTMKEHMDADKAVRIQYAAKYAQTANYWKYYIGQSKGLRRLGIADEKAALEAEFTAWVNASEARRAEYGEALNLINGYYDATDARVRGDVYALEAGLTGSDVMLFAVRVSRSAPGLFSENADEVQAARARLTELAEKHFKEYDQATDRDLFVRLMTKFYNDIPAEQHPSFFATVASKYKGDFGAYAAEMYSKSILVSKDKFMAFLAKPSEKALAKDLAAAAAGSVFETYLATMANPAQADFDRGYRLFVKGLREMKSGETFAPDANSTMRLTFGKVAAYDPMDAVHYDHFTTHAGILEKMDNSNPEFVVPANLEAKLRGGDFGRWADADGTLHVCFIHGTDITGGNSGSPVLDANGHLIGCAFDGNWEAMSGDIAFEPDLQRTISVDIRYVMWVLDKLAGATNLIDEMNFVNLRN
ncbi:MAG: S46 family peptidase, partial [Flavobacteriales bacterium]